MLATPNRTQATPPRPAPPSSVFDEAGVLTGDDLAKLNARIDGIRRENLGNVGVAIVRSIGDAEAPSVARNVLHAWRLRDEPRRLPPGRIESVLLLIVLEPGPGGAFGVAAGGADGAERWVAGLGDMRRSSLAYALSQKRYAEAARDGLVMIENRLRTAAGVGLGVPQADPAGGRPAPTQPGPRRLAPAEAPRDAVTPTDSSMLPTAKEVVSGVAWMAGIAVTTAVVLIGAITAVVFVIQRRQAAKGPTDSSGS